MTFKCPGQDRRNIKAETLHCATCGTEAEIFSDEVKVKCRKCGELICRERLPSCVDWCKFARDCVGEERWRKMKGSG